MKLVITMVIAVSMGAAAVNAVELEGIGAKKAVEMMREAGIRVPEPSLPMRSGGPEKREILVPEKTIQLLVERNSVNLADYSAEMSIRCSYKAGLFWPQTHSCGKRELPVEIAAGDRLLIPGIEAFDGPKGRDLRNFAVSVVLRKKGDNDGGYLFSMSVRGKEAIDAYVREKSAFSVLKLDAALVDVLLEGRPLAGSELSKDPNASLLSSVSIWHSGGEPAGIMLVTPLTGTYSFYNQGNSSEGPLAGFKGLSLNGGVFVEKAGEMRKLELVTALRLEEASGETSFWRSRVEIQKTADGLKRIGRVDLKK
ncbi:MAG: hypothetical protein Q8O90_08655 [Elusimicrobiota bacterium]|nr:hypothetical protein [Elusimicrobiota bacterium]